MKVVIVDDERIARRRLKQFLAQHSGIDVVGEADCGLQGVSLIDELQPDVAFLDVEMPDINGFDILPYLKKKPIVVFCSSFDRYALKAFEVPALDYLLKPVDPERLTQTLVRVRERLAPDGEPTPDPTNLKKLIAREGSSSRIIWLTDSMMFQKSGRYTQVMLGDQKTHLVELTLDYLEKHVPPTDFFRISRQTMIRRSWVETARPGSAASGEIITPTGQTYPVSRARWKAFKEWLFTQA